MDDGSAVSDIAETAGEVGSTFLGELKINPVKRRGFLGSKIKFVV